MLQSLATSLWVLHVLHLIRDGQFWVLHALHAHDRRARCHFGSCGSASGSPALHNSHSQVWQYNFIRDCQVPTSGSQGARGTHWRQVVTCKSPRHLGHSSSASAFSSLASNSACRQDGQNNVSHFIVPKEAPFNSYHSLQVPFYFLAPELSLTSRAIILDERLLE